MTNNSHTSTPDTYSLEQAIADNVRQALHEDIRSGDITAQLIPATKTAEATVITREAATICGTQWVNEVFRQVDSSLVVTWLTHDGDQVSANQPLFKVSGHARGILTGERSALNFLQLLSGTATRSKHYADQVAHTPVRLLDTRKTIPGLRLAQKYAVSCGGCYNHRIGLFDAFLIKENHIMSCGSIAAAVEQAHQIAPGKKVEVEVENLDEMQQALKVNTDIIMLDNFSLQNLSTAVEINQGRARLEASGGITSDTLVPIAETGVDYISIGALTKDCKAVDLSMRLSM